MPNANIYLGFDGGGTKTDCVAVDVSGKMIGRGAAGPSNPLRIAYESAISALETSASEAIHTAGTGRGSVAGVCAGLAGTAGPAVAARVAGSLVEMWPQATVRVITDAEAALSAAANTGPAVVLIAGTGSIAIGRNARGEVARAGGYGPWVGDPGSAYDIGRRAAQAAALASDGDGPPTSLTQHILKALDCKGWAEVAPKIATGPEAVFPRLFPIVVACADKGDLASRSILSRAAVDLAKLALAVVGKLGLKDESFVLARTGGVFRRTILLDHRVERLISHVCARAQIGPLAVSPALAAARMAIRLAHQR